MGGTDTLSYAGYTNPVNVNLWSATSVYYGNATAIGGYISGLDTLVGGSGTSDTLNSQWGYNTLSVTSNGTSTLDGALTFSSFENVNLGYYDDTATIDGAFQGSGGGAVNLNLGYQNDTLTLNNTGSITGSVSFGGDYDTLNYSNRTSAVTATYNTGTNNWTATSVGGTVANDFERINTGSAGDSITATGSDNPLFIDSGAGDDTIAGSNASDTIYARTGTDSISGGSGDDQIRFANGQLSSADTVDGGTGYDKIAFDNAATVVDSDFAKVTNVENVDFTNGTNSITLEADASRAAGTTGDALRVTTGSGVSTDTINASAFTKNLTTNTGGGNDSITSGIGADTFEFISNDLTSADYLKGGTGTDAIKILGPAVVDDSDFTQVSGVEKVVLDNTTNNVTLGVKAAAAAGTSDTLDPNNSNSPYLTLQGGAAGDTFTIFLDSSGTNTDDGVRANVEAFGGAGNDVMTVGRNAAQLVDSAPGQLNLHGGDGHKALTDSNDGYDVLNITGFGLNQFDDFTRNGELGDFIYFAAVPTSETMDSEYFNMKVDGFDKVNWDKSPTQSVSSTSELSLLGANASTISSGSNLDLAYNVNAAGAAEATSVSDGTSAFNSSVAIGTKKSTMDAAADLGLDTSLDVGSVVTAMTSSGAANAFSVGFSIGMDRGSLTSGANLDVAIDDNSLVTAQADTTTGNALAVSSNDVTGLTALTSFSGTEAVSLAVHLGLDTEAIAATTNGSAEAVGWMGSTGLEKTSITSSGLGLIAMDTKAINDVSAESVTGPVIADAFSAVTGISTTNFNFADTASQIGVAVDSTTNSSANSVLGNAFSSLTSAVMGLFGQGNQNQIVGTESVSAIVTDHGFSDAASVGGNATATANQSVEALSGYNITTTENLLLQGKSNLNSNASSSVVDA